MRSSQTTGGDVSAGMQAVSDEFQALSVRYLPEDDVIAVMTTRNGGFLLPRALVTELADETPEALSNLKVWPDGSCIELEMSDIHISVHGLLSDLVPAMMPPALSLREAPIKRKRKSARAGPRAKSPAPSPDSKHRVERKDPERSETRSPRRRA